MAIARFTINTMMSPTRPYKSGYSKPPDDSLMAIKMVMDEIIRLPPNDTVRRDTIKIRQVAEEIENLNIRQNQRLKDFYKTFTRLVHNSLENEREYLISFVENKTDSFKWSQICLLQYDSLYNFYQCHGIMKYKESNEAVLKNFARKDIPADYNKKDFINSFKIVEDSFHFELTKNYVTLFQEPYPD